MHTHPQFRRAGIQFRALGNERRMIILTLLERKPRSGDELTKILRVHHTSVVEHLCRLMNAGFVVGQRRGRHVFFSLTPEAKKKIHLLHYLRKGVLES